MNKINLLILGLVLSLTSMAQDFSALDSSSEVKFKIKNLGITVGGTFSGLSGKIKFDPNNLNACSFEVSVNSATVNTGIDLRDNHLKNEDYFDVKNYPKITFISTRVTTSNKSDYLFVFGNLTIKKVTKEISFPFKATPKGSDYIFEGEFKMNRKDFGVGGGEHYDV